MQNYLQQLVQRFIPGNYQLQMACMKKYFAAMIIILSGKKDAAVDLSQITAQGQLQTPLTGYSGDDIYPAFISK